MNILVTGVSGFVGAALFRRFLQDGKNIFGLTRSPNGEDPKIIKGDILSIRETDLRPCQPNVVIHCAGISQSHLNSVYSKNSQLYATNVKGALNVARQASLLNCKRFVFLSSLKVNGETTAPGKPFTIHDMPNPLEPYGISKWEAEKQLIDFTSKKGMELVIIRSPLIYGPHVKGNFAALVKLVELSFPLPFGAIGNQRSFIGIDNLIDLIITCIEHPKAGNQTFLASDDHDLSTTELLQRLAHNMSRPSRLFSFPPHLLAQAAKHLGKTAVADRLLRSLQADISETKKLLGWVPPVSVDEGLSRSFSKL